MQVNAHSNTPILKKMASRIKFERPTSRPEPAEVSPYDKAVLQFQDDFNDVLSLDGTRYDRDHRTGEVSLNSYDSDNQKYLKKNDEGFSLKRSVQYRPTGWDGWPKYNQEQTDSRRYEVNLANDTVTVFYDNKIEGRNYESRSKSFVLDTKNKNLTVLDESWDPGFAPDWW